MAKTDTYRDSQKQKWTTLRLSRSEALLLAENLARQVRARDSNTERPEFAVDGGYFTVFVDTEGT